VPDEGKQLGLLLETARSLVDEEFRRSERLETKSRSLFTSTGALFAVVMATTAGVLNALIDAQQVDGWVYPVLGGFALISIVALIVAFAWVLEMWRLRESHALKADTIEQYISYAERGNIGVAKNLIKAYAKALGDRRLQNEAVAEDLINATRACAIAALASLLQLGAVFVALMSK